MSNWQVLESYRHTWAIMTRVVIKATTLFVIVNLLFAVVNPMPLLNGLSVYNTLIPGRERLPYGVDPASNNLSLFSLDAMFESHVISGSTYSDAFRIIVLGDSSVWGILLENHETLTGQLNSMQLVHEGQPVQFFNIGHPILSVLKDLMLLENALAYDPDLIIWLVTLESLNRELQLDTPLVQNNPSHARHLINTYDLSFDANDTRFVETTWLEQTLIGQRRNVADWLRLQLFGFAWATTGVDQSYVEFTPRSNDLDADVTWYGTTEGSISREYLAWDVLIAGHTIAESTPVILINEPIFVADGTNSDVRYNAWYAKWVYDWYRSQMTQLAQAESWNYIDLWNTVSSDEFTDSPVHLTPVGTHALAEQIASHLLNEYDFDTLEVR